MVTLPSVDTLLFSLRKKRKNHFACKFWFGSSSSSSVAAAVAKIMVRRSIDRSCHELLSKEEEEEEGDRRDPQVGGVSTRDTKPVVRERAVVSCRSVSRSTIHLNLIESRTPLLKINPNPRVFPCPVPVSE